jgi:hypothetical protein
LLLLRLILNLIRLILSALHWTLWAAFVMEKPALVTIAASPTRKGPAGLLWAWDGRGLKLFQLRFSHFPNLGTAVMRCCVALAVAELAVRTSVIADLVGTPVFEMAVPTAQITG